MLWSDTTVTLTRRPLRLSTLPLTLMLLSLPCSLWAQDTAVKLSKEHNSYILQNAYVTAEVDRTTGDLKSLKYGSQEMMGFTSGHHAGYWEQNPSGAAELTDGVSIDPAANSGDRAEIYIRGKADGKSILRGPGSGMIVDLEIRYSLGKEDHGVYTYAIFSHPASYPATGVGESRFGAKLNGTILDWLSDDPRHNELMPTGYDWDHGVQMNMKEARKLTTGTFAGRVEHKYDYCADQFTSPAFGWSSTKKHVGLYLVNPSQEFLSAGPTRYELIGHLDDGEGGDPTILDYWRSSHYGGTTLDLAAGEEWSKVVGPILIYVNSGPTPQAMFTDALREASHQSKLWPFAWVSEPAYPLAAQRATVSGKLTVDDPQAVSGSLGKMLVGLVAPDDKDGAWQHDAKSYQFWVDAAPDGTFTIPKVRPGNYLLAALRDGKQLWEIGVPNRNGSEFFMGDQYDRWGNYLLYAHLFPNDVHYTIGKSDFRKDWFFEQVPNVAHADAANPMDGSDTTWTIDFNVDKQLSGTAVLRAALSGVGARHVFVTVNGKDAGDMAPLVYNATINRDGIQGAWTEHDVRFPAKFLKTGTNQIALRVPKGNVMAGVIYDYLRLEWVQE